MITKRLVLYHFILGTIFISCFNKIDNTDVISKLEARYYHNEKYAYDLPYRFYAPTGLDIDGKYPMVLVLHGGGGRGTDNRSHIGIGVEVLTSDEFQRKHPCFVMAPQCPTGSQWVNTTFTKTPFDNYKQEEIPESDAMKMIIASILSLIHEFNIDDNRLYVMGSSMGASGTWDLITRYPDLFAAAVTMSGVSDPSTAAKIAHMPIWAFHGRKDAVSPLYVTQNMIDALRKHQSRCRFTVYDDRGHDIEEITLHNGQLIEWLFSQKKEASSINEQ